MSIQDALVRSLSVLEGIASVRLEEAARALGYGERFLRRWEFYLAYCEAGFEERWVGSVQVVLAPDASR